MTPCTGARRPGRSANVLLPRVAFRLDLGDRRHEVAVVDDGDAQSGEPLAQTRYAKGRRSHIDTPAIAAEVEGNADDMNRTVSHEYGIAKRAANTGRADCTTGHGG